MDDIPTTEPAKNGYWEIYADGRKIWHKTGCHPEYKFNEEEDVEFPEDSNKIDSINQELDIVSQEKMLIKSPSEFVTPKIDVQDGDYITIMNEGEYRTLPQDPDREVLTFKVKVPSGDVKKMSMNATSQKELMAAWGDNSDNWVNKRCAVDIVKQKVFTEMKDVIFLHPVEKAVPAPEEKIPAPEEEPPGSGLKESDFPDK